MSKCCDIFECTRIWCERVKEGIGCKCDQQQRWQSPGPWEWASGRAGGNGRFGWTFDGSLSGQRNVGVYGLLVVMGGTFGYWGQIGKLTMEISILNAKL